MGWDNKVVWGEGLFLQPQHLQQQERYLEWLIRSSTAALTPFSYGFTRLEVDNDLLTLGKFSLRSAAGLMPDGTPFSIPGDVDQPATIDLPETLRNATLHLVLPTRQPGAIETAPPDRTEAVRQSETTDAPADAQAAQTVRRQLLRRR